MCGVYRDVLPKDGASHMAARTTLSNGRTAEENGDGTVCIYFFGHLCTKCNNLLPVFLLEEYIM
jgi:hypothetical protein